MILSEVGAALRSARKRRKLTLQELSKQTGVHYTTLSELERGRVTEFGVRKLMRVAATLGLELHLRPAGQSYTLDDVASELRNQTLGEANATRPEALKGAPKQFYSTSEFPEHLKARNALAQAGSINVGSTNELAKLMNAHKEDLTKVGYTNELAKQLNSKNDLLDRVLGENWTRLKKAT